MKSLFLHRQSVEFRQFEVFNGIHFCRI